MADKSKNKKKKPKASEVKAELRSEEDEKKPTSAEVDEFVAGANRWADKLRPHAAKIVGGVLLVTAAGVGIAVWLYMAERKAMKATTAYAIAAETATREVKAADTEPDPSEPKPTTDIDPDRPEPFPSREARAEATLTALGGAETFGAASALLRANALMDLKRFDEAARAYKEASAGLPLEAALEAKTSIGYALEAKAEVTEDAAAREQLLTQAINAFKEVQPVESGPGHDATLYHEARLLAVLGKRDEAATIYKKALELHPDTLLKYVIEARLEALSDE